MSHNHMTYLSNIAASELVSAVLVPASVLAAFGPAADLGSALASGAAVFGLAAGPASVLAAFGPAVGPASVLAAFALAAGLGSALASGAAAFGLAADLALAVAAPVLPRVFVSLLKRFSALPCAAALPFSLYFGSPDNCYPAFVTLLNRHFC